jgi:hypothetical protein
MSASRLPPFTVPNNPHLPRMRVTLCFSHLRWDFVYQRPQHLMTRAAQDGHLIFIEEPIFQDVSTPSLDLTQREDGIIVAVPVLPQGTTEGEQVIAQRTFTSTLLFKLRQECPDADVVFWYYTPMALRFSDTAACAICVYDCMDELSAFRGAPPGLIEWEEKLFKRADLVFTGGRSLHESKRLRHPDTHLFPSSIDQPHFSKARSYSGREPPDQAGVPGPRLGFFGVVDERMDLALVAALADSRPTWQFIMLGPVVKVNPASLPKRANIHWLGAKSYAELPSYLAGWDLGIMPFALNEATRFISPTKTPEFLAAGLRVISTPITDVVRPYGHAGLVSIAESPGAFLSLAEGMLASPDIKWLQSVDAFLAGMSWDLTWAGMRSLMNERIDAARSARPESMRVPATQGVPGV